MQLVRSIGSYERTLPTLFIAGGVVVMVSAVASDLLGVGTQGLGPNQLALAIAGAAILLTGVALNPSDSLSRFGHWLLVAAGALVAGIAADVLVIGGLPAFLPKQVMLFAILLGLILTNYGASVAGGEWDRFLAGAVEYVAARREQALQLLGITAQLVLVVLVMGQYRLENQTVYSSMMLLCLYGFVVHFFLPAHLRLPFFLLLSVTAIVGILGLGNGVWLLLIGLGLVGLVHLPVTINQRLVILLAAGVLLILLRGGQIASPVPAAVWPILGSMFMFRLIIYFYDLAHSKDKASSGIWQTLSYFFLLPNIVFPFFPVVDFSVFKRTYYNTERFQIYQRGIQLIFYGITQLILYRFLNRYVMLAQEEVTNAGLLVRFVLTNYLLYVRVTGQFHIIIGILHLFGFNLPKVNHLNFMATSFTDLWRRANIYWKDFMQKMVFYPTQYRFRRFGLLNSLLLSTAVVIFVTWFLHSYQWFWLRGSFLMTWQDASFWALIGVWLVTNVLWETKRGRKRSLKKEARESRLATARTVFGLALRSASVTALISVLWSYWFSSSAAEWLSLWSAGVSTLQGVLFLLLTFVALIAIYTVAHLVIIHTSPIFANYADPARTKFRPIGLYGGLLLALFLLGLPGVQQRIGGQTGAVLADLTQDRLSAREEAMLQRGYYENLLGVHSFNNELWELYAKRPTDWPLLQDTDLAYTTGEFLTVELTPSTRREFHGAIFSTNRWGMRDQDYELTPPPNSYRIALLGPSYVMGSGVGDGETFETLVEARLNEEHTTGEVEKYEILNFGVAGYSVLQHLALLEEKVLSFSPDAVLVIGHPTEVDTVVRNLAGAATRGTTIPYDYLNEVLAEAGVTPDMNQAEAERLLRPYATEINEWAYGEIRRIAEEHGMLALWAFMPTPEALSFENIEYLTNTAKNAGFVTFDLSRAYGERDLDSLAVAPWDKHPNAVGHRLLAEALYQALLTSDVVIDRP